MHNRGTDTAGTYAPRMLSLKSWNRGTGTSPRSATRGAPGHGRPSSGDGSGAAGCGTAPHAQSGADGSFGAWLRPWRIGGDHMAQRFAARGAPDHGRPDMAFGGAAAIFCGAAPDILRPACMHA